MAEGVGTLTEEVVETSFFLTLGNVVSTLTLAIGVIILGAIIGPEGLGLYSLVLATPGFLNSVVDLGLPASILHFASKLSAEGKESNLRSYTRTAITTGLLLATIASAIGIVFSGFISSSIINRPGTSVLVALACLTIFFQAASNLVSQFFIGSRNSRSSALMNVSGAILKTISQIALVLLGYSVFGALLGNVMGTIAAAGVGAIMLLIEWKPSSSSHAGFDLKALTSMISYGLPLYVSTFLTGFISQYQASLMGELVSNAEIGNYRMAVNFSILIGLAVGPISTSLVSAFSKLDPKKDMNTLYGAMTRYISMILMPLALGVILLSDDGIRTMFGGSFPQAPLFLSASTLIYLTIPIGGTVLWALLNWLGETKLSVGLTLISTILFIVIAKDTMLRWGILGMIVSWLVSSVFSLVIGLLIAKTKFGLSLNVGWVLRFFAVLGMTSIITFEILSILPIDYSPIRLAIGCALLFSSYFTILPLMGALDEPSIRQLESILKRNPVAYACGKYLLMYERMVLRRARRTKPT